MTLLVRRDGSSRGRTTRKRSQKRAKAAGGAAAGPRVPAGPQGGRAAPLSPRAGCGAVTGSTDVSVHFTVSDEPTAAIAGQQ